LKLGYVPLFFVAEVNDVGVNYRFGIRVCDSLLAKRASRAMIIPDDLCTDFIETVMGIDLLFNVLR
jgi:hypothetical protein